MRAAARVEVHHVALRGKSRMPCIVVDTKMPGPRVVVAANLHGDEATGVAAVHAIAAWLPTAIQRGRVALFPTLNPRGLERGTRAVPGDDEDPNRSFPGNPKGTPAQQHAHAVWTALDPHEPDFVIDLHADAAVAVPYALVDRVLNGVPLLFERCVELADSSGLSVVREYTAPQYHAFGLARSFTGAVVNGLGIPAVTLEVGPRRAIDPVAVETAVTAIRSMLAVIGVADARPERHPTCVGGGPWRRENGPRTEHTGVFVPMIRPGIVVDPGTVIVEVRDLVGEPLDTIAMPVRGFVMSYPDQAWLGAGVAAATLAVPDV